MRPVRPSQTRNAAAKLEREDSIRLVLELAPETRRALKVKAAQEGKTVKAYLLDLLRKDGVAVGE
jgi:hypothetical protein